MLQTAPTKADLAARINYSWLYRATSGSLHAMLTRPWPTLRDLNAIYGRGAASLWVRTIFRVLLYHSAAKDPALAQSSDHRANAFTAEVLRTGHTIADILVFAQMYAAGRFQSTIAPTFSPDRLATAFWEKYLPWKRDAIASLESAAANNAPSAPNVSAPDSSSRPPSSRSDYLARLRQWASTSDASLRSSLFAALSNPALSPSDNLALLTAAAAHNNIHITPRQNSP